MVDSTLTRVAQMRPILHCVRELIVYSNIAVSVYVFCGKAKFLNKIGIIYDCALVSAFWHIHRTSFFILVKHSLPMSRHVSSLGYM